MSTDKDTDLIIRIEAAKAALSDLSDEINARLSAESDPKLPLHLKRGEIAGIGAKPKREKKTKVSVPKSAAILRLQDEYFWLMIDSGDHSAKLRKYSIDEFAFDPVQKQPIPYDIAEAAFIAGGEKISPTAIIRLRKELKEWIFSDDSDTETERAIIGLFTVLGGECDKVETKGTWDAKRKRFIKTTATKGASDTSGYFNGKCIKIEVKHGADRKQSDNQKEYQAKMSRVGIPYLIARELSDVDEFIREFAEQNRK